jgi:trans-aconitate methyltransferase
MPMLLELAPSGRVLAIDASPEMVALARRRLGGRAQVWCQDVLELYLNEPVDAIVSTATLLTWIACPGHSARCLSTRWWAEVHPPLGYVRLNASAVRGSA